MRDIVERLELQAFVADKIQSGMKPLIMDCLNEIVRLRIENENLRERCARICEENNDDAVMQSYGTYYATRIRKS